MYEYQPNKEWLSFREFQKLFSLSRPTIVRLIKKHFIETMWDNPKGRWLVRTQSYLDYIKQFNNNDWKYRRKAMK